MLSKNGTIVFNRIYPNLVSLFDYGMKELCHYHFQITNNFLLFASNDCQPRFTKLVWINILIYWTIVRPMHTDRYRHPVLIGYIYSRTNLLLYRPKLSPVQTEILVGSTSYLIPCCQQLSMLDQNPPSNVSIFRLLLRK